MDKLKLNAEENNKTDGEISSSGEQDLNIQDIENVNHNEPRQPIMNRENFLFGDGEIELDTNKLVLLKEQLQNDMCQPTKEETLFRKQLRDIGLDEKDIEDISLGCRVVQHWRKESDNTETDDIYSSETYVSTINLSSASFSITSKPRFSNSDTVTKENDMSENENAANVNVPELENDTLNKPLQPDMYRKDFLYGDSEINVDKTTLNLLKKQLQKDMCQPTKEEILFRKQLSDIGLDDKDIEDISLGCRVVKHWRNESNNTETTNDIYASKSFLSVFNLSGTGYSITSKPRFSTSENVTMENDLKSENENVANVNVLNSDPLDRKDSNSEKTAIAENPDNSSPQNINSEAIGTKKKETCKLKSSKKSNYTFLPNEKKENDK